MSTKPACDNRPKNLHNHIKFRLNIYCSLLKIKLEWRSFCCATPL